MRSIQKRALAAILTLVAVASFAFAQGPVQKRLNYSINVRHALRMGDYELPPGRYVLYQINQNDVNMFALYQNDLRHSPIAMIRTTRVDYQGNDYPEHTSLMLNVDEASSDAHPVLRGWNIPGMDGWEIISVVPKNDTVMTRIK